MGVLRCFDPMILKTISFLAAVAILVSARGVEKAFDFAKDPVGGVPAGFRAVLSGAGKAGEWQILQEDVPSAFAPLNPNAPSTARKALVAQTSRDPEDERFPMLVYEDEVFRDFRLSVRFKTVAGGIEQMAGIAFRFQDEKNYYVVRASSLGNTFRFYRVSEGRRDRPIGPDIEIPKGVWHELGVECKGNRFKLYLNGKQAIPDLTDGSFSEGKIAFWTKSDSVSYFTDLKIDYDPREILAKTLVQDVMKKYPRILGMRVLASTAKRPELHVVASTDENQLGQAATQGEQDTQKKDLPHAGKSKGRMRVAMPIHDKNGDAFAVVHMELESFTGQTDENAISRAMPIVRMIQERLSSPQDLLE